MVSCQEKFPIFYDVSLKRAGVCTASSMDVVMSAFAGQERIRINECHPNIHINNADESAVG
jgi:hypothetical protein